MTASSSPRFDPPATGPLRALFPPPLPLFLLQPLLNRIVRRIAVQYPEVFDRLGDHTQTTYLIDPVNLPFVLLLKPDPQNPQFKACQRSEGQSHDALIAGRFLELLQLVDGSQDGDAMFFSRNLEISGNTEAVVSLRNALDDVDGSIAMSVADLFGPPGRMVLQALRRAGGYQPIILRETQ